MKLSTAHKTRWVLVHSPDPDKMEEVELIAEQFFASPDLAWKWFHRHHKLEDFILAQAVEVEGLENLSLKD